MSKGPWKRKSREEMSPRELVYDDIREKQGLAPEDEGEETVQEEVKESAPEPTQKEEYTQVQSQPEKPKEEKLLDVPPQDQPPAQEQAKEPPPKILMDVSQEMADWAKSKGFDPEEIKESKTLFNSVKSQMEAEKKMHQESQKSAELERAFNELKPFIDWNRIRQMQQGIVPPQQQQGSPQPEDKEKFFADFAERGPLAIDDYIRRTPAVQQIVARAIQTVAPVIVQNAAHRVRLDDAYMAFNREYPHLKNFEEDVGKIMFEDIQKNPAKSIMSAMHDAAKSMQKLLNTYKEEGKKEAVTIHEERKIQNIPPGDRASKDRVGPVTPTPPPEEQPETLSDYMTNRRAEQDKRRTKIGYQYQQTRR